MARAVDRAHGPGAEAGLDAVRVAEDASDPGVVRVGGGHRRATMERPRVPAPPRRGERGVSRARGPVHSAPAWLARPPSSSPCSSGCSACWLLGATCPGQALAGPPSLDDAARVLADPTRPFTQRRDAIRVLARATDPAGPRPGAPAAPRRPLRRGPRRALARGAGPGASRRTRGRCRASWRASTSRRTPSGSRPSCCRRGARGAGRGPASWRRARATPDLRVRAAAVTALGDLGGPAARARLLELLAAPGARSRVGPARRGPPRAGAVRHARRQRHDPRRLPRRRRRRPVVRARGARERHGGPRRRPRAAARPPLRRSRSRGSRPPPPWRSSARAAFDEVVRRLSDPRPGVRAAAAAAVGGAELRRADPPGARARHG